jgi:hypothetical protein
VNAGQAIGVLCCLGFVLALILAFEVALFRISCALCRVPQPGLVRTAGVVLVMLVVPGVVDAIFGGALYEVYRAAEYPLWEAGLVQFFLALPIHMAICSAIHARMVRIKVTQGIAVWLVEKLMKLSLLLAVVGVVALLVAASQAKG